MRCVDYDWIKETRLKKFKGWCKGKRCSCIGTKDGNTGYIIDEAVKQYSPRGRGELQAIFWRQNAYTRGIYQYDYTKDDLTKVWCYKGFDVWDRFNKFIIVALLWS